MKKFKELTAADFPGIDPVKFTQWKDAVVRMNKRWMIAVWILIGLNIILIVAFLAVSLGGLLLFGIMFFINRGDAQIARKLYRELGLNPGLIKAARRGELGTKVASPWAPPPIASVPPLLAPSPEPPLLSAVEPPPLPPEPPPLP